MRLRPLLKKSDGGKFKLNRVIYPTSLSGVRTSGDVSKKKRRLPFGLKLKQGIHKPASPIRHRLRKTWNRLPIRLLILMTAFWFIFMPLFVISCQTQLAEKCQPNGYRAEVSAAWLWWRRNLLLSGWTDLKQRLRSDNPYLAEVAIDRQITGVVRFSITERVASAVLETVNGEGTVVTYLISKDGIVLEIMNTDIVQNKLPVIKDRAQLDIKLGEGAVSPQVIDYSQRLSTENISGYILKSVSIDELPRQMTANLTNAENRTLDVLISTQRPLEEQLMDLGMVLTYLTEKGTYPVYVDLRLASATPYRI
jgi:hypothetical protein